jgi:hypothetical protein
MVKLCQRLNLNMGMARTALEVNVFVIGFTVDGTLNLGTLLLMFSID